MDTELGSKAAPAPNPRRAAAGKLNRLKRRGLSPDGRQKLREAAIRNQPWRHATGPKTAAGKARAAANGMARQAWLVSVRELRADLRALRAEVAGLRDGRRAVGL